MPKTRSATRRIVHAAKRCLRRRHAVDKPRASRDHGYVCAFVQGHWCGGWYETYFSVVSLVSGTASACALRLHGLPPRFEALFLLCKLAHAQSPGMMCQRD